MEGRLKLRQEAQLENGKELSTCRSAIPSKNAGLAAVAVKQRAYWSAYLRKEKSADWYRCRRRGYRQMRGAARGCGRLGVGKDNEADWMLFRYEGSDKDEKEQLQY